MVKNTTSNLSATVNKILSAEDIIMFQKLVRKIPIADNVLEYAVKLVGKTRPNSPTAPEIINNYVAWGAGPRAAQFLVLGAKCNAALKGKYSPDIEDVRAVALPILRHRLFKNYKAEAEGYSTERIIKEIL